MTSLARFAIEMDFVFLFWLLCLCCGFCVSVFTFVLVLHDLCFCFQFCVCVVGFAFLFCSYRPPYDTVNVSLCNLCMFVSSLAGVKYLRYTVMMSPNKNETAVH